MLGVYNKGEITQMGVAKTGLIGSGNGIRKNPYLASEAEGIFGLKLKIPEHLEEAAFGAALFGGICAKYFENSTAAHKLIRYL